MGKNNIPNLWVSQVFRVKQKSIKFPKYGKMNSHNTGRVWEKNKHSKVTDLLKISGEAEIHAIPKIWEK